MFIHSAAGALAKWPTQAAQSLDRLTPTQREAVMYWVGGLAPLATNATTPFFTKLRFDQAGLPEAEVKRNVVQESARQLVSAGTQVVTYFGPSALAGAGLRKNGNKNLWMFLIGTAVSYVGYAVIRPLISAELILRWLYRDGDKAAPPRPVKSVGNGEKQAVFAGFA